MSKPLPSLTAFAGSAPPWSLSSLDGNFTTVAAGFNDLGTYSNPLTDTSGTANQITVTPAAGLTVSLTFGLLIYVKMANTTTSMTVVLNINALGNQNVVLPAGGGPTSGSLVSGGVYGFFYDGTNFQLVGGSSAGVTSIGITSANVAISVSGSPVTGSGSISLTANTFTSSNVGVVPASGGGTTNFLRADGSWAAPAGTTYSAGTGLGLAGTTFSIAAGVYRGSAGSATITISSSAPSGGSDGDIWFQY